MLTSNLLRVRTRGLQVRPYYLDTADRHWLDLAMQLRELFTVSIGLSRGEIEEESKSILESEQQTLVAAGFAKLFEDRCRFEVVAGHPPEEIREVVFAAAAKSRKAASDASAPFDRSAVFGEAEKALGLSTKVLEEGLFADLKSDQTLLEFDDITPERLLERYNVGLAQAVLLKATKVEIQLEGETPARLRRLFRKIKFHRLICDVRKRRPAGWTLTLDGPMSLFSSTLKYGLQLACFLPTVLLCKQFSLRADLLWGPRRAKRIFNIHPEDGLASDATDESSFLPPESAVFVEAFVRKNFDWTIAEAGDILRVGDRMWVPDYLLTHKRTGKKVHLEVLGFWRRSSLESHLNYLRSHLEEPFVLALSERLHVEEEEIAIMQDRVHVFKNIPIPEEIVRLAESAATCEGSRAS